MNDEELAKATERALAGNLDAQREKLAAQHKLFVRDRIALLLDEGSFVEDALLANAMAPTGDLPADGVVTGAGRIDGRPVCVVANDTTVKAGSWGARTVEKMVRLTEYALRHELPIFWLVDSAGARITDQVELFPGRRGAGRIFYNQIKLSGRVPQVCCLFGPSAAGGAYIPSFCDIVVMVEGNASMYLGSPRMAEMVIGEITTLEEMGGARMHATVSGCGDNLAVDDEDALDQAKAFFTYLPDIVARGTADVRGPSAGTRDHRRHRSARRAHPVRHARTDRRARRRGVVLRDQAAVRARGHRRPRPPRRCAGRHRRQQPGAARRRAVRRLGRQVHALHQLVRRVQRAARVPGRRARLHGRHRRRAPGDHPPRRQDGHGRVRGNRAQGVGHRAQGLRRRACTRCRARRSSPRPRSRCRRRRSR